MIDTKHHLCTKVLFPWLNIYIFFPFWILVKKYFCNSKDLDEGGILSRSALFENIKRNFRYRNTPLFRKFDQQPLENKIYKFICWH